MSSSILQSLASELQSLEQFGIDEVVKKLKWVIIAGLGVLVVCGSLLISQHGSSPPKGHDLPVMRPAPPDKPSSALPVLGKKLSLEDVQSLYRQGQRQLYNSSFGEEYRRARELLQRAQALLEQLGDEISETDRLYWQVRVEFELGNWYHGAAWGDPAQAQEALPYYLTTEQIALKLTEHAPNFSEGYRLLGESQMRIISLKGWLQALTNAGAAKSNLERALELDPQNAEAHLALGVYYLYAPALFGGDLERAVREFHESEALTSDETVRFLSHRWRGVAYARLGKVAEAREAFERALAIYPKSSWDRNELNKLR
ncbi:MAG: TRAP transporter TatT component family protein [Candidatus Bipolaricaulia bacterium]